MSDFADDNGGGLSEGSEPNVSNSDRDPGPPNFGEWKESEPKKPEPSKQKSPEGDEKKTDTKDPEDGDSKDKKSDDKEPTERKAPKMVKVGDELIPESDLQRQWSKWKAADNKFREVAEGRKQVQAFFEALKNDPAKILNDERLPIDRVKLAEAWLGKRVEEELSGDYVDPESPIGKRLAKMQEKLSAYEQRELEETKKHHDKEFQEKVQQRRTEISETLSKAMEKTVLSKNKETAASTLREMATYMRAAKENGIDVTPEELAEHVENKRYKEYGALVETLDGEALVKFLGEGLVNKIRKYDLSRLRPNPEPASHKSNDFESRETFSSKERKFINPSDARMSW